MLKLSKTELLKLQKTLKTDAAIGRKLGIPRQYIHKIRTGYGIASSYAGNAERNEKIIALYKEGMTGTAIAEKVGLGSPMVYTIINKGRKKVAAKKLPSLKKTSSKKK